jgi:peptidase C39-like protein
MTLRERAISVGLIGRVLDFVLPRQEGESWCWAACATGVSTYFDPSNGWTQCSVAEAALSRSDCCDQGACDHPSHVYRALEATGNLALRHEGPVSREVLIAELKLGRPVVVRIQYPDVGHFVVIDGYGTMDTVHVRDPADESSRKLRIGALERHYNRTGTWSHTYFTCEQP